MTPPSYSRPAVQHRDAMIFYRWANCEEPKDIMADMGLTKSQYYDGLARHRRRIEQGKTPRKYVRLVAEKIGKNRTARKRESK